MKSFVFWGLFVGIPLAFSSVYAGIPDLSTIAEKSEFTKTGRADETEHLCHVFQKTYPGRVKCLTYGITPEGRHLKALVISDSMKSVKSNPVVFVQAGIHAGEIDGKDAIFLLLKDALSKKINPDPLRGLTLVFVPIVNLDGHERFGKWNRPNQIGPEEMGWRVTAQNLNLNRDFAKVETPEIQALLKLWDEYDPVVSLDLHVTDGAKFQPEVGVIVAPGLKTEANDGQALQTVSKTIETDLMAKLAGLKHLALPYYPEFETEDDPASGFSVSEASPRLSEGYWSARNRIGILVETHSWKTYSNRVKTHYDVVRSVLELAQRHAKEWIQAEKNSEQEELAGKMVSLQFKHNAVSHPIDFPGYHYAKEEKSKISGGPAIHYFEDQPETWHIPFFGELVPIFTVKAPTTGYYILPSVALWMKPKLDLHHIEYSKWGGTPPANLETFRVSEALFNPKPYEGRQPVKIKGMWALESMPLPAGTLFVPIHQKNARLAMMLLEPSFVDSFASWGFLNAFLEQKEYMEDYVTEEVAAKMLLDPKIREAFEVRLKTDPDFAKSPKERLEFFYRKHPSFDSRMNLIPVYRS